MATRANNPRLVIDARPCGPEGVYAHELVQGRRVLDHLIDVAEAVLADASSKPLVVTEGPPPADAVVLRTDRLYDANRLRRALKRGKDAESAVYWRLDRPGGLQGADDEMRRRQSYQPLGKYWALDPARWLAKILCPSRVTPNAVTLAASSLMIGASGLVAFAPPTWYGNPAVAAAMALALVLDTADGHLARLQGTASEFGRHLDAWLDELCDMLLHAGIAWAAFHRTGRPVWLLVGMAYAMGKYVFYVGSSVNFASQNERKANSRPVRPSFVKQVARLAGHADIRWHLWIVLAAVGRLDAALLAYTIYYPARAVVALAGKAKEARRA